MFFTLPLAAASSDLAGASSIAAPDFISYGMSLLPAKWQGLVTSILVLVGALRLAVKPIVVALHAVAAATETRLDDEFVARVESSKGWRTILFLLDYVASVKIVSPARTAETQFFVKLQTGSGGSGPTDHPGATAAASATMAAGLALCFLIAVMCTGCASNVSRQRDISYSESTGKPVRVIDTKISARTLVEAKSELANFKASNTDKTQSLSIGRIANEANSTNTTSGLRELVELLKLLRAAP